MPIFKRFFPVLIFGSILFYVILYTPYPDSWQKASTFQILSFFLPLLLFLTFSINLFLKYFPYSFVTACGITFLLTLLLIGILNPLTLVLVIILIIFFIKLYPKLRYPRSGLTKTTKIPKLTHVRKR